MKNPIKLQRVVAVQDDDLHWYVIPYEMNDLFFKMEEEGEKDQWTEFMDKFSEYQTGGDLNNIELWAKITQ